MEPSNRKSNFFLGLIALGFSLAFFVALVPVYTSGIQMSEGDIASRTVRAPNDISFTSEALTRRRQDEAAAAVPASLTFDPSIANSQQSQLNTLLTRIRSVLEDTSLNAQTRSATLDRVENLSLSPTTKEALAQMSAADFTTIETEARRTLASIFQLSLPESQVADTRERAATYVDPSLDRETSTLVAEIIRPFIVTNQKEDSARTEAGRQAARAGVAPVQVAYAKNQVIVEKDGPVTPEALEALRVVGAIDTAWQPEAIGASVLLALLLAAGMTAGWQAFRPQIRLRQLLALAACISGPIFFLKLSMPYLLPDDSRHFLTSLIPTAAATMVLSGFVGLELALLAAAIMAVMAAFAAALLLDVTIVGVAGSIEVVRIALVAGIAGSAGVFAVRNAERLTQFLLGGLVVGLSIIGVLAATWMIDASREWGDWPWMLMVAAANGGLSAFLSAGVFVTMGSLFGVTTRLQLLEMSQLSQPLLLRLQDEAPSTFQHSVIVANLAEKGAHVIDADALLTRVGCYYHDIGKLVRPGFFIENQMGGSNPHDALDPSDSARIISDHVKDGAALAREYKLPAKVAAFIPEHHGTRVVAYFYRRAAEDDPTIDPDSFRYPGPKPRSRETAIAMLADSCEAAVRSSPDHSAESIDSIVDEVFSERLTEGQLDESDLTLKNLRALNQSFRETLRAIYHPRVEYPAPTEAELLLRGLPLSNISENN